MSLRFIFGRAGTGKTTYCLEELVQEIQRDPLGSPLIFLVPEQSTHQMEMQLARTPELGGILRAQVLSFRRLGWRIFAETGGGQKAVIGETGKRMLLRRLLLQFKSELQIFARSAARPGMADLLAQMIGEFKTYRITPKDLRKIQDPDSTLTQKLQELALLYDEFNQTLGHDFLDPDDELTVIAEKIPDSPSVQNAILWVDGFKGFTPQELYVLEHILHTAHDVNLTLPLDPDLVRRQMPSLAAASIPSPSQQGIFRPGEEIFQGPWQTLQSLLRLAHETGTSLLTPIFLESSQRFQHPELQYLEKFYFYYPTQPYTRTVENIENNNSEMKEQEDVPPGITLISAVNRRAEVEGVAKELRHLAREKGLRWQDMAVLTRDLTAYQEILQQVFNAYDLPFFLDSKRPLLHHPLIELLLSVLEIARSDWAYEPLFRALKTGFFPLSQDSLDRLENYCLAHGIRGEAWSSGREWHYQFNYRAGDQEQQQQFEKDQELLVNQARETVLNSLKVFVDALLEPEVNVRTVTEALYNFLVKLLVPDTLQLWAQEAQNLGNLSEARLQGQIWDAVLNVFDEMVTGLGQIVLDIQDYTLILASGLENLKMGLIPPGLDQIMLGSLDRSRNPEVKVLFLLGANEGTLPSRPAPDGVLDSEEREHLEHMGLALAPKGKAQLFEEQFFIYTALTRATDHLYISYPLTDEEGKGLTVSPVIARLRVLYPKLKEKYLSASDEELDFVSHPQPLLAAYANQLLKLRQGQALSPLWQAVQSWFQTNMDHQAQVQLLEKGASALNQEEGIPKVLARRLYGKRLMASVSRLEEFSRCPFAHYAKYGLKLKERPLYQLASPDMGQFFHAVLHDFAERVREENLDWGTMTKEDSWNLVSELAETIAPKLQNEILLSNARYRYLKHKLKRTVHHAVRVLAEHARNGIFVPIQLEVQFGPGKTLPGIEIPLEEGNSLLLRGQIDRIDAAQLEGQIFLRILDYKSRQPHVSLNHIYYGLDLQLLAYLDAALQGSEVLLHGLEGLLSPDPSDQRDIASAAEGEASEPETSQLLQSPLSVSPAGFLYFPVIEPQLEAKVLLSSEELETKRIKAVKVKGYLLANQRVLEAMDQAFAGGQSDLLGLKLTKTLEFRKNSNVLSNEQFFLLREHLHAYLRRSGEEIMKGNISISPYRQGKDNGCQYCEYKPVCHFDSFLPENQFRTLPQLKDADVWERILSALPASEAPSKSSELVWLGEDETFSGKEDENHG